MHDGAIDTMERMPSTWVSMPKNYGEVKALWLRSSHIIPRGSLINAPSTPKACSRKEHEPLHRSSSSSSSS